MSPIYYIQVAIQRSWQFPSDPVQLAGFLVEYSSIPSKGAFLFNTTTDGGPRQRRNQRLDPMISDLILQAIDDKSEKPIDMFLPALIEDPTRSSAWQNSSHDRGLGYSCLQLYLPPQKSDRYVQEVCRTGDRIACVGIEFSTEPQILAHELSLRESIKVIRERCSRNGYTDPLDFWLLYACFRARAPDKSEKVWNDVLSEKPDAERWTWKNRGEDEDSEDEDTEDEDTEDEDSEGEDTEDEDTEDDEEEEEDKEDEDSEEEDTEDEDSEEEEEEEYSEGEDSEE